MEAYKAEAGELLQRWRKERQDAVNAWAAAQVQMSALTKMIDGMEQLYPEFAVKVDIIPQVAASAADALVTVDVSSHPAENHRPKPSPAAVTIKATDVVRDVLREQPNRWFSTGDMVREFRTRGAEATPTAIRLALRRTSGRESDMRETDNGQLYRFHSESASSDTLEAL